jgi:two-component system, cell cycle sensor histidine kinase and response regulator CckA
VQLRQVLVNLITNASESIGDEPGEVSLSLSNVDDRVCIRVEDTGCGLSEAEMARIFSPFYTTKVAGRGLGLAAVQDIVKSHDGEVVIRSTVNEGSTFEVWLPGGTMDEAIETGTNAEEAEGTGLILIVDDEEAVRKVAERILLRRGFNVISEGDSDKAVSIFDEQHQNIDLVLLDVMMPKRNGFELMAIFRKLEPNIPVLLVTGYGSDVAELDDPERTAILRKPYRLNELVQAINQLKATSTNASDQLVAGS